MSASIPVELDRSIILGEQASKLSSFRHFPLPIFLITRHLDVIELNIRAHAAVEQGWIATRDGKLSFNSSANTELAMRIVEKLFSQSVQGKTGYPHSERFVLRNPDTEYRAYTLSRESHTTDNMILTIQGNLEPDDLKMQTLIEAFGFSRREAKIMEMMIAGMKPKEIAYEAGISLNTVRSHLRTLYAKMQVRDYNHALSQAVRLLA